MRPSTAAASNYLSNLSQDIEIKDGLKSVKNNTITNEIGINDTLDSSNIKESAKNESEISYKKGKNTDTNTTYPEKTIADIRINFDVSSSEAVKELQKILGLEEDGIFGPKTSAAYQAALSEDTPKNKEESSASITNAMLD